MIPPLLIVRLRSAPDGVIAEAVGGAYSAYARVSIYTGLPTVLGWGNHEGQWRDYALQGSRAQDIEALYTSPIGSPRRRSLSATTFVISILATWNVQLTV